MKLIKTPFRSTCNPLAPRISRRVETRSSSCWLRAPLIQKTRISRRVETSWRSVRAFLTSAVYAPESQEGLKPAQLRNLSNSHIRIHPESQEGLKRSSIQLSWPGPWALQSRISRRVETMTHSSAPSRRDGDRPESQEGLKLSGVGTAVEAGLHIPESQEGLKQALSNVGTSRST